jgi:hypothetical protein
VIKVAAPAPAGAARALRLHAASPLVIAGDADVGDVLLSSPTLQAVVLGPRVGSSSGVRRLGQGEAVVERMVPVVDAVGRRTVTTTALTVVEARGREVIVRVQGVVSDDDDLRCTITYVLGESGPLRARMDLQNTGGGRHPDLAPGWVVRWGALTPLVPGIAAGVGFRGRTDWVGADADTGAVAFTLESGLIAGEHGPGWSVLGAVPRVVEAKAQRAVSWLLHVGTHDLPGLVDPLRKARGEVVKLLTGQVHSDTGPMAGAVITLRDKRQVVRQRARSDAHGVWRLHARPGEGLTVYASAPGRTLSKSEPVEPGRAVPVLRLGPMGDVRVQITDETGAPRAARLLLRGPSMASDVVRVVGAAPTRLPLTPGFWSVVVDGGPLRQQVRASITVDPKREAVLKVRLPKVLDEGDLVALDLHALGAPEVVARACAATDVQGFVIPGQATSTPGLIPSRRVDLADRGRLLLLPVATGGREARAERPDVVLAEKIQQLPGVARFILGPRSPGAGYLNQFGFRDDARTLPAGGFSLKIDGLEVAGPGSTPQRDLMDAWATHRLGAGGAPLAGSGAQAETNCGAVRVWITPGPLLEALRGIVVASAGPLLHVARRDGGLEVRLQAVPRHRPRALELWAGGKRLRRVAVPKGAGVLDLRQHFKVPPGASLLVRTVGGPAGAKDRAGWASTGIIEAP